MKFSLGFGIERLGLLPLRYPKVALALLLLFTAICLNGVFKLQTDDALSDLFRSHSKVYTDYKHMSELFPSSERDVLVVVEGKDLLTPQTMDAVRNIHLDLQFAEAVDGALSMFSMRGPPNEKGYAAPLVPDEIPEGAAFDKLKELLEKHPLIGGKLLSKRDQNGQIALILLSLKNKAIEKMGVAKALHSIDEAVKAAVEEGSGLSVSLAGIPVMRQEIRDAIKRDRLIFNTAGFFAGFFICLLFFRRPLLVFIASICPAFSVAWALGLLGYMNFTLNTLINVIPPLVMVIAFSDAMHMVFSIRRSLAKGLEKHAAIKQAIFRVGPACVLTSLTTSLALLSLCFTDSGLIRQFGMASALATLMAFVAVIIVVPTLSLLFIKDEEKFAKDEVHYAKGINVLDGMSRAIAGFVARHHRSLTLLGIALTGLFAYMHSQMPAQYRLSDQVPIGKQSTKTAHFIDEKLQGATPVHIVVEWPKGLSMRKQVQVLDTIENAHKLMEERSEIANVWSVVALRRWMRDLKQDSPENMGKYLDNMPAHLLTRFVNEKKNAAIITGRLQDIDAEESLPIVQQLEKDLEKQIGSEKGYRVYVTGLATVSAIQSSAMINQLNRGLIGAVVMVIILIGLAFRSWRAGLLSCFPNLLPIVAGAAGLYLQGRGLEYASVIGLTVAFGLAVDDSIHFLNRLNLEQKRHDTLKTSVDATLAHIGPVLMLTTIVLVLGLSVTVLSALPPMRLFGSLAMITILAALIADLFFLPATIHSWKIGVVKADGQGPSSDVSSKETSFSDENHPKTDSEAFVLRGDIAKKANGKLPHKNGKDHSGGDFTIN